MPQFFKEMLRHKYTGFLKYTNLVKQFTVVQYKLKDQSKFLGLLWSLINPLVMLSVLFFAFGKRLGANIPYYPIYLLIGVVQYNFFINSTATATTILFSHSSMTRNVIFPKEILVVSSIISNTVQFIFEMAICMALAIIVGTPVTNTLLLIPAVCLLEILLALWSGLLLSCCHVFVKDIDNLWQIFSRVLFFITPIFFNAAIIDSHLLKTVIWLNPLSYMIKYSRMAIIEGNIPPLNTMFALLFINACLLFIAFKFFRYFEKFFAEYV